MRTFFFIFLLISFCTNAQTNYGRLSYKVNSYNSIGKKVGETTQIVEFVSDSMIRVDQQTGSGLQTAIINYKDSTYIILMTISDMNIAIEMPKETLRADNPKYTIKYKCKKEKIAGIKAKKAIIVYEDREEEIYYAKEIPGNFNQKFSGLKGYPVKYAFRDESGSIVYELSEIDPYGINDNTFIIPNDYHRMTFEEFQKAISE